MMVDPVPTDSTSDSEVTRVGLRLGARTCNRLPLTRVARTCNRLPLTREEEIANGSLGIFPDRGALVDDRVAESDSEADLAVEAGRNSFTPHQETMEEDAARNCDTARREAEAEAALLDLQRKFEASKREVEARKRELEASKGTRGEKEGLRCASPPTRIASARTQNAPQAQPSEPYTPQEF
eukprot:CAMPEP_0175995474 /NCGR_PEP_ID=MMETSP0108-20121206/55145_1 /TAXON_ID=195067 ORGANISM="Goniomonas pacifica, Strain CCMP1869" /NCGR_SAMPLE_ID=MMETSP0108 /ASSEMBLY_ACC=CAM_ASM_000204 /LENGTH=181 /DNA_ID=CAMNT_0017327587 /DNA_START=15 /DNA_END=560 /DNA_ORIENTATION=-